MHPGLFTDEAFVQLSDGAQIFFVGLLTQADDQGIFEWKPVTLEMRLRPVSRKPIDPLLEELIGLNFISSYELDGRKFGAVRNFVRYQRPKKPNYIYPILNEFRTYVGLSPPEFPTGGEPDPPTGGTEPAEGEERRGEKERKGGGGENARERATPALKAKIPKDWFPDLAGVRFAKECGIVDIAETIGKFVDYYTAQGELMADWGAAWKVWCGRENKPWRAAQ